MELVSGGTAEKDFYSHAREGRDFVSAGATWKCTNFYSHAREGRDLHGADNTGATDAFLLTRPRGA